VKGDGQGGMASVDFRASDGKVELLFGGDWEINSVKDALRHMLTTLEEQTNADQLKGIITSWNQERGVGVVALVADRSQRFFMFSSRVLSGPEPKIGSIVTFDRSKLPQQPNRLPLADHIRVTEGVQ
jgi:hypothetical protein